MSALYVSNFEGSCVLSHKEHQLHSSAYTIACGMPILCLMD